MKSRQFIPTRELSHLEPVNVHRLRPGYPGVKSSQLARLYSRVLYCAREAWRCGAHPLLSLFYHQVRAAFCCPARVFCNHGENSRVFDEHFSYHQDALRSECMDLCDEQSTNHVHIRIYSPFLTLYIQFPLILIVSFVIPPLSFFFLSLFCDRSKITIKYVGDEA